MTVDWWKLLELLGALAIGALAGWRIKCSVQYLKEKIACRALDRLLNVRTWAGLQIDERLLDADAQLGVAQSKLSTLLAMPEGNGITGLREKLADVQCLAHDARMHLNRAGVIVLAQRDGRIAFDEGPDGSTRFWVTKEPPA
jgi:hypothetical protein